MSVRLALKGRRTEQNRTTVGWVTMMDRYIGILGSVRLYTTGKYGKRITSYFWIPLGGKVVLMECCLDWIEHLVTISVRAMIVDDVGSYSTPWDVDIVVTHLSGMLEYERSPEQTKEVCFCKGSSLL